MEPCDPLEKGNDDIWLEVVKTLRQPLQKFSSKKIRR